MVSSADYGVASMPCGAHCRYYDMTNLNLSTWNMKLLISDMQTL